MHSSYYDSQENNQSLKLFICLGACKCERIAFYTISELINLYMYIYIYIYIYIHKYKYIYLYMYIYIYVYT